MASESSLSPAHLLDAYSTTGHPQQGGCLLKQRSPLQEQDWATGVEVMMKVRGAHVTHSWIILVGEHHAFCLMHWPQHLLGLWLWMVRTGLDVNTICSTSPILKSTSYNPCPAVRTLQPLCSDAWWQSSWQTPSLWLSYPLSVLQAFSPSQVVIVCPMGDRFCRIF